MKSSAGLDKKEEVYGKRIEFYRPVHTIPVSVTGVECGLNCAHCGGYYLNHMVKIDNFDKAVQGKKAGSCLVSGGCSTSGKVDFESHVDKIKELKRNFKINMHTGLLSENDFQQIQCLADVVSMDIPAGDSILKEVYGLDHTVGEYIDVYKRLKNIVKVVPHICVGLDRGIDSEISILSTIAETPPEQLCIIVFKPTHGTKFERRNPPEIDDVIEVISHAKTMMPNTRVVLGCMRPGGTYRSSLDSLAVASGADGLVMPSKSAVDKAQDLGFEVTWKNECCVF